MQLGLAARQGVAMVFALVSTWTGWSIFLAPDIGRFDDPRPFGTDDGLFVPDQTLPEYQGDHGLAPKFFQAAVDNARAWWREHQN